MPNRWCQWQHDLDSMMPSKEPSFSCADDRAVLPVALPHCQCNLVSSSGCSYRPDLKMQWWASALSSQAGLGSAFTMQAGECLDRQGLFDGTRRYSRDHATVLRMLPLPLPQPLAVDSLPLPLPTTADLSVLWHPWRHGPAGTLTSNVKRKASASGSYTADLSPRAKRVHALPPKLRSCSPRVMTPAGRHPGGAVGANGAELATTGDSKLIRSGGDSEHALLNDCLGSFLQQQPGALRAMRPELRRLLHSRLTSILMRQLPHVDESPAKPKVSRHSRKSQQSELPSMLPDGLDFLPALLDSDAIYCEPCVAGKDGDGMPGHDSCCLAEQLDALENCKRGGRLQENCCLYSLQGIKDQLASQEYLQFTRCGDEAAADSMDAQAHGHGDNRLEVVHMPGSTVSKIKKGDCKQLKLFGVEVKA